MKLSIEVPDRYANGRIHAWFGTREINLRTSDNGESCELHAHGEWHWLNRAPESPSGFDLPSGLYGFARVVLVFPSDLAEPLLVGLGFETRWMVEVAGLTHAELLARARDLAKAADSGETEDAVDASRKLAELGALVVERLRVVGEWMEKERARWRSALAKRDKPSVARNEENAAVAAK